MTRQTPVPKCDGCDVLWKHGDPPFVEVRHGEMFGHFCEPICAAYELADMDQRNRRFVQVVLVTDALLVERIRRRFQDSLMPKRVALERYMELLEDVEDGLLIDERIAESGGVTFPWDEVRRRTFTSEADEAAFWDTYQPTDAELAMMTCPTDPRLPAPRGADPA